MHGILYLSTLRWGGVDRLGWLTLCKPFDCGLAYGLVTVMAKPQLLACSCNLRELLMDLHSDRLWSEASRPDLEASVNNVLIPLLVTVFV